MPRQRNSIAVWQKWIRTILSAFPGKRFSRRFVNVIVGFLDQVVTYSPPRGGGVDAPREARARYGEAPIQDRQTFRPNRPPRPLQLRWLREISLMSRPPLLC